MEEIYSSPLEIACSINNNMGCFCYYQEEKAARDLIAASQGLVDAANKVSKYKTTLTTGTCTGNSC